MIWRLQTPEDIDSKLCVRDPSPIVDPFSGSSLIGPQIMPYSWLNEITPNAERLALRFRETVEEKFAFLETDYKFDRTFSSWLIVEYTSSIVTVTVTHGYGDYLIEISIERRIEGNVKYKYSLDAVVYPKTSQTRSGPPSAVNSVQVTKFLGEAAVSLS